MKLNRGWSVKCSRGAFLTKMRERERARSRLSAQSADTYPKKAPRNCLALSRKSDITGRVGLVEVWLGRISELSPEARAPGMIHRDRA